MVSTWESHLADDLPSIPLVMPLRDSLIELGSRKAEADSQVRRGLRGADDVRTYRESVRSNFWQALGGRPVKTALNPQIVGVLERDGYVIEKIILESRPRFYVTALAYVPTTGKAPYPAVLRVLGHYPQGKAFYLGQGVLNEVQAHCIQLALKGYFVLTFDPYGQVERGSYFDPRSGNNHFIQGTQCFLTQMHIGQHYVWDSIRAMDYLVGRPEIDLDRICTTGTSGGGAQTLYHAALDDRIAVSIPVCYLMQSHWQIESRSLHPESVFPGYLEPFGPNNTALAACVAPKPQLIIGALHDPTFPAESTLAVYEEVREIYRLFNAEDQLGFVLTDSYHGYTLPMRRAMYRWLNRCFDVDADDQERPIVQELPEDLFCAPEGNVATLTGATVYSMNREYAHALARERKGRQQQALQDSREYVTAIRDGLARSTLLQWPRLPFHPLITDQAETSLDRSLIVRYEPEPGFHVRLSLSIPKGCAQPCPIVVHCNEEWHIPRPSLFSGLMSAGIALAIVNVRLGPAYMALTFGRTEVGMAIADLTAAIDLLSDRTEVDRSRVALYGKGRKAGLVALMAGVLDDRARSVAASGFQRSLAELVEKVDIQSDLQLIPGALRYYDVSDLCAALCPRPLLLIHSKPDTEWPKRMYSAYGKTDALHIVSPATKQIDSQLIAWFQQTLEVDHTNSPGCVGVQ